MPARNSTGHAVGSRRLPQRQGLAGAPAVRTGQGWLLGGGTPDSPLFPRPGLINLDLGARLYVEQQLGEQDAREQVPEMDAPDESVFNVFICHTTDDKDDVVRTLATALDDAGLRVWYDEFELKIGDSLRHKID